MAVGSVLLTCEAARSWFRTLGLAEANQLRQRGLKSANLLGWTLIIAPSSSPGSLPGTQTCGHGVSVTELKWRVVILASCFGGKTVAVPFVVSWEARTRRRSLGVSGTHERGEDAFRVIGHGRAMPAVKEVRMKEFPPFRLDPDNQCLWRRTEGEDDERVRLTPKAFAVLQYLVEHAGRLVTHDELLEAVWRETYVQPEVLKGHIFEVRRALGDRAQRPRFIETLARRGYQFIAAVREGGAAAPAGPPLRDGVPLTNLPTPASDLIGREAALDDVADLLAAHRIVTLTGAGGIGKTRLGLEVARQLLPDFADGVWLAELAPLSDADLVADAVAAALGLELAGGAASPDRVAQALGPKQLLLVLDNCEHVIDRAARMAEGLARANPKLRIMATSREPLRAEGEYLYRVPPLDVPTEEAREPEDMLRHGAVQLFVARALAAASGFVPDARTAALIGAVCRRLDGIPLAIELAAARTATLGVEGLAARLDDRFRLLTGGHRTALPRHQTLRATLDWSYELLPEPERVVLRRLSIFAGGFTLEAATAIGASAKSPEITALDVIDGVANLVAKSLVGVHDDAATVRYRLLETTRAYALEKLTESGEFEQVARRHAEYYRDLYERAEAECETRPTAEWLEDYRHWIDNVRAALDWAFSPSGDASIGVALTATAVPLWFQLSLMVECRGRVERALAGLEPGPPLGARREMQLYAALGASLIQIKGHVPETGAAWTNALRFAERLDDAEYQLRALWGLWSYRLSRGEHQAAQALAQRFSSLAANTADPADRLIGARLVGVSLHYLGDQTDARRHLEHMLSHYVAPVYRPHAIRFQYDQRVMARAALAWILWLQGFPDQAMRTATSNVEEARASDHALSLCYALAEAACPVALLVGDLAAAERFLAMLLDRSARHALSLWHAWGRYLDGVLRIKYGDALTGLQLLRTTFDGLGETRFVLRYTAFLDALVEGLTGAGQAAQGLVTIDGALARSERNEERWCVAEMLRIKGELVLLEGGAKAAVAAAEHFRQALDWARRQGALSWELRAATSLARLRHQQARTAKAQRFLAPVYARFTEGFETADLKAARALLNSCGNV
jgi:predicted ATPase/DNA-binding winged helix-turn-helix (wHTH) protein